MGAMPAEAESRQAPIAQRLTTVRPRQAGTRAHPTGVRACSAVLRADPPAEARPFPPAEGRPVPRARPPVPGDGSRRLRLTRRGRAVLVACAAAVLALLGFAVASGAPAPGSGAAPGAPGHSMSWIVVQPGQTLWSIAVRADPRADPRLVVQRIMTVNALSGGSIAAGQRILVPRS